MTIFVQTLRVFQYFNNLGKKLPPPAPFEFKTVCVATNVNWFGEKKTESKITQSLRMETDERLNDSANQILEKQRQIIQDRIDSNYVQIRVWDICILDLVSKIKEIEEHLKENKDEESRKALEVSLNELRQMILNLQSQILGLNLDIRLLNEEKNKII